jgi:hypothetical protein
MIIRTTQLLPSGPDAIDDADIVSRADPTGADQVDAEHLSTDLAVGD